MIARASLPKRHLILGPVLLFWALLALVAPASAQQTDPSEARNGSFGGKLLITDDLEGFWKQWEQPDTPQIATTSKVTLAKPVYGMILFYGCRAAATGKCKVTAHFEIIAPDGRPYDKPATGEAWSGPPAADHALQASLASFGFRLEPKDQLGRYRMKVVLTDDVAGRSLYLSDYIVAEPVSSPDDIRPRT
jgi:hypothetical protein